MLIKPHVSSSKPPSHLSAADIARCLKYDALPPLVDILPANVDVPLPIRFRAQDSFDYIIDVAEEIMPEAPNVRFSFELRKVVSTYSYPLCYAGKWFSYDGADKADSYAPCLNISSIISEANESKAGQVSASRLHGI